MAMYRQLIAAAALAVFAASGAWAQDKKPAAQKGAQKTQQNKMKKCNADAKGMKGDERKKFMSSCLKG